MCHIFSCKYKKSFNKKIFVFQKKYLDLCLIKKQMKIYQIIPALNSQFKAHLQDGVKASNILLYDYRYIDGIHMYTIDSSIVRLEIFDTKWHVITARHWHEKNNGMTVGIFSLLNLTKNK